MKHTKSWGEAYLNGIRALLRQIRMLNLRLDEIQEEMTTFGGSGYGERVQTSPRGDALEKKVIRAMEQYGKIQEDLLERRLELWKKQDVAVQRIQSLKDGNRKEFLLLYYIDGMSMTQVAMELGHAEPSSVYHLKDEALNYFNQAAELNGWKK